MTATMCGPRCPGVGFDGDGREADCGTCRPVEFVSFTPAPSWRTRFWFALCLAVGFAELLLEEVREFTIGCYHESEMRDGGIE